VNASDKSFDVAFPKLTQPSPVAGRCGRGRRSRLPVAQQTTAPGGNGGCGPGIGGFGDGGNGGFGSSIRRPSSSSRRDHRRMITAEDPLTFTYRKRIADFATEQHLSSLSGYKENVAAGGLMSYGPNLADLYRRARQRRKNCLIFH
jgi:hypothetical protein